MRQEILAVLAVVVAIGAKLLLGRKGGKAVEVGEQTSKNPEKPKNEASADEAAKAAAARAAVVQEHKGKTADELRDHARAMAAKSAAKRKANAEAKRAAASAEEPAGAL